MSGRIDENHLAVVLGDVMGKKWGAWYFAFAYAGYVRSALRGVFQSAEVYSPSAILYDVNRSLYKDAKVSEVFSTVSVVILNNKNLTASYTGAGDLPLFLKRKSVESAENIRSKGTLLGFSAEGEYEDAIISLQKGDTLLLTTDGIIESRNTENKQYGLVRFIEQMSLSNNQSRFDHIVEDFTKFTNEHFEDDISLIGIEVN